MLGAQQGEEDKTSRGQWCRFQLQLGVGKQPREHREQKHREPD